MQRVIKYRAWDKLSNCMRKVRRIDFYSDDLIANCYTDKDDQIPLSVKAREVELMQFTGLHDKSGTEVFEGDILKDPELPDIPKTVNQNKSGEWVGHAPAGTGLRLNISRAYTSWSMFKRCEVIGNIYENPELLEADNAKG
jgi:uncharacterized phage protein (TIGR01671 family)